MSKREKVYCDGCGKEQREDRDSFEDNWYQITLEHCLSGTVVIKKDIEGVLEEFEQVDFCSKECAIKWFTERLESK